MIRPINQQIQRNWRRHAKPPFERLDLAWAKRPANSATPATSIMDVEPNKEIESHKGKAAASHAQEE